MSGKKPINVEIRRINRSSTYRHFFQNTALAKQNLVSDLQLCLPTVTKNIDALVADGLIEKSGSQGHTGGRRATTYSIVRDARIALGIDVTNNHVTVVATDLTDGNLSAFFEGLKAGEGAFKKAWDVYWIIWHLRSISSMCFSTAILSWVAMWVNIWTLIWITSKNGPPASTRFPMMPIT